MSNSVNIPTQYGIPLKDVPNYLPRRNGKKVHKSTVVRWALKGTRGRILETTKVGGIRYTTLQALMDFMGNTFGDPVENKYQHDLSELLNQAGW